TPDSGMLIYGVPISRPRPCQRSALADDVRPVRERVLDRQLCSRAKPVLGGVDDGGVGRLAWNKERKRKPRRRGGKTDECDAGLCVDVLRGHPRITCPPKQRIVEVR